jgi:hypothetical protein
MALTKFCILCQECQDITVKLDLQFQQLESDYMHLMRHLWLVYCGTLRVTHGKGYQVCLFTHYFLRSRPSLILLFILDTGRISIERKYSTKRSHADDIRAIATSQPVGSFLRLSSFGCYLAKELSSSIRSRYRYQSIRSLEMLIFFTARVYLEA